MVHWYHWDAFDYKSFALRLSCHVICHLRTTTIVVLRMWLMRAKTGQRLKRTLYLWYNAALFFVWSRVITKLVFEGVLGRGVQLHISAIQRWLSLLWHKKIKWGAVCPGTLSSSFAGTFPSLQSRVEFEVTRVATGVLSLVFTWPRPRFMAKSLRRVSRWRGCKF